MSSEKQSLSQQDAININLTQLDKHQKATKKLKKAKALQVSFALAKNVTAASGNKTVYVRVNTPTGALLGGGGSFNYENRSLQCTMKRTVEYGGKETPMTLYYNINQALQGGTYRVSIFADGNMIGSKSFTLD